MKRVSYSLETKYKVVKSEEGMYRKKEITESINIKKRTQVEIDSMDIKKVKVIDFPNNVINNYLF